MVQRVFPRHLTWSRRLERGPGGLGLGCWVGASCVPKDGGLDGSRLDVGTLQSIPGCTGTCSSPAPLGPLREAPGLIQLWAGLCRGMARSRCGGLLWKGVCGLSSGGPRCAEPAPSPWHRDTRQHPPSSACAVSLGGTGCRGELGAAPTTVRLHSCSSCGEKGWAPPKPPWLGSAPCSAPQKCSLCL